VAPAPASGTDATLLAEAVQIEDGVVMSATTCSTGTLTDPLWTQDPIRTATVSPTGPQVPARNVMLREVPPLVMVAPPVTDQV
jgi:hypothetical protein